MKHIPTSRPKYLHKKRARSFDPAFFYCSLPTSLPFITMQATIKEVAHMDVEIVFTLLQLAFNFGVFMIALVFIAIQTVFWILLLSIPFWPILAIAGFAIWAYRLPQEYADVADNST